MNSSVNIPSTGTATFHAAGFKSRALRVGGSATDAPAALTAAAEQSTAAAAAAATEAPNASDEAAAAAGPASSSGAIAGDASWDVNSAGRKHRAAAESVPSPNVSPKLAAAVRHGQQCRVQPGEDAADEDGPAGASNCQDQPCAGQELSGSQGSGSGAVLAAAADPTTSTDEDSVPLVGSRLAARAQDRGTPMAAGRGIAAGGSVDVVGSALTLGLRQQYCSAATQTCTTAAEWLLFRWASGSCHQKPG